jgi:hypothetical protein
MSCAPSRRAAELRSRGRKHLFHLAALVFTKNFAAPRAGNRIDSFGDSGGPLGRLKKTPPPPQQVI